MIDEPETPGAIVESVEHVVVEHQVDAAEPAAETESETVIAAEAAVALASATAAAAELDAAERLRRLEMEGEEWRNQMGENVHSLSSSLQTLREEELQQHAQERHALAESFRLLSERQEAIETQFRSLIPPESGATEGATTAEPSPILGTVAEVEAGPVSLDASLAAETESESSRNSGAAHPVRRRRWI